MASRKSTGSPFWFTARARSVCLSRFFPRA
jgi:hypothetical protein